MASEPLICHGRKSARFSIYGDLLKPRWWVSQGNNSIPFFDVHLHSAIGQRYSLK